MPIFEIPNGRKLEAHFKFHSLGANMGDIWGRHISSSILLGQIWVIFEVATLWCKSRCNFEACPRARHMTLLIDQIALSIHNQKNMYVGIVNPSVLWCMLASTILAYLDSASTGKENLELGASLEGRLLINVEECCAKKTWRVWVTSFNTFLYVAPSRH